MIYFITQQDRYVKIGYTKSKPGKRLAALQVGNPFKLELWGVIEGDQDTEAMLHHTFELSLVRGEWYALTPDIVKYMHEVEPARVCVSETEIDYLMMQHSLLDRLRERKGCIDKDAGKWLV